MSSHNATREMNNRSLSCSERLTFAIEVFDSTQIWMPDKTRFVADWVVDSIIKSTRHANPSEPGSVPTTHEGYWALLERVVDKLPLACPLNNVTHAFVAAMGDSPAEGLNLFIFPTPDHTLV